MGQPKNVGLEEYAKEQPQTVEETAKQDAPAQEETDIPGNKSRTEEVK